jgi:hypothetical protein
MASASSTRKRSAPKTRTASASAGSTRRKPSSRKPAKGKTRTDAPSAPPAGKLEAAAREIALAQLGIAAHLVETVGIRMIQARIAAPKQWEGFVKRGEQVRRDLEQAGDGLRSQIIERVGSFDPREAIDARISRARALMAIFGRRRAAA